MHTLVGFIYGHDILRNGWKKTHWNDENYYYLLFIMQNSFICDYCFLPWRRSHKCYRNEWVSYGVLDGKVTVEGRTSPDFDPCHLMFISEYPLRSTFALEIVRAQHILKKEECLRNKLFCVEDKTRWHLVSSCRNTAEYDKHLTIISGWWAI